MKKNIISMAAAMAVLSACGPGVPQLESPRWMR